MHGMVPPWPGAPATPSLPLAFILSNSAFRIGHTRKPPGFQTPHIRSEHLGFLGLGNGIGMALLLGQLTGVHHHKAQRFLDYPPVAILYSDLSRDALPPPTAGCLSLSAAWFLHQQ